MNIKKKGLCNNLQMSEFDTDLANDEMNARNWTE